MGRGEIAKGEYYHIFNRGVEKRRIFLDDRDRWRFMTLLCVFQGEAIVPNIRRAITLVQHSMLDDEVVQRCLIHRVVTLLGFCLMPNHFHLILRSETANGISRYMQRLGNAYTKYFNMRNERTGHLFGSRFHFVRVDRDEYFSYLSAYVHMNPRELESWRGREDSYPWSSFQDYLAGNRWGLFLDTSVILAQFKDSADYHSFVKSCDIKSAFPDDHRFDRIGLAQNQHVQH